MTDEILQLTTMKLKYKTKNDGSCNLNNKFFH